MSDKGAQRRLATIVAIDVAGYSARAEADEAAAAAEIAELSDYVAKAAADHGGRVFNTAGDGFMLEFPTVSGALEAAEAVTLGGVLPVRAGVHLGEVIVTPSGDLLGHGVNVAARIQALAPAGGVLVSADVQRAIRGPLAARLAGKGQVRLDKMDETIGVFALTSQVGDAPKPAAAPAAPPAHRFHLPPLPRALRWPLVAAAVLLLVGAGAVAAFRDRIWPPASGGSTVAVADFTVLGDDAAGRRLAAGVGEEVGNALSGGDTLLISAAMPNGLVPAKGAARADYVLGGSVERSGDQYRVRVRLDDNRRHALLWTETMTGSAADPKGLEVQVAAKATTVISMALSVDQHGGRNLDGATISDYIQALVLQSFTFPDGAVKARALMQRVVARAPDFASGHASLASIDSTAAKHGAVDEAASLRQEAAAEARRALALDPKMAVAYVTLSRIGSWDDWIARMPLVVRAVAVDPTDFYANDALGYLQAEVGRTREGVFSIQRGVALNSMHPGSTYLLAVHLAAIGRYPEARRHIDRLAANWPALWTDCARLALVSLNGAPDEARDLIRQSAAHAYPGEAPALDAWRAFLDAREGGGAAARARAISVMLSAVRMGAVRRVEAIQAFAQLDDPTDAFAAVEARAGDADEYIFYAFFTPGSARLRADPRFWPLMARHGLAAYWLKSGRWPDFCGDGADLAACREQAQAALKAAAS